MSTSPNAGLESGLGEHIQHWQEVYRDLHAHPELGFAEHRTAAVVERELRTIGGWEVTTGVGGTGVVGVLRNGEGPVVLLRADMDALPVQEDTALDYASTSAGQMHACGHDVHTTCLLGACRQFAANAETWRGTVVAVFQPAEEIGQGARAMLDDGFLDRFPAPSVSLGQHVGPFPVGTAISRPGTFMSGADSLRITVHGTGSHASTPHLAVDPIVLASAIVLRLQTFSARLASGPSKTLLTPGAVHAGTVPNVIPEQAELLLSLRSFDQQDRQDALQAVDQIVRAEAAASQAPREPDVQPYNSFPITANTPSATERVLAALQATATSAREVPTPVAASEDFGLFGSAANCPSVYWHFGGTDPERFSAEELADLEHNTTPEWLPANHSPHYAPDPGPTLPAGIKNLLAAGAEWLGTGTTSDLAGQPAEEVVHP